LNEKLGETLIIEGIYSTCMEYSSFQTIKKDKCYDNYQMELELSGQSLDKDLVKGIYEMYVCNASIRLIVKGTIEKNEYGYGHLSLNNARINVLEIIKYDDIKYSKIKKSNSTKLLSADYPLSK
jgi:hypothetical protein